MSQLRMNVARTSRVAIPIFSSRIRQDGGNITTINMEGITDMIDYESAARFLFNLLDDIDTVGDIAKEDLRSYRNAVEIIQRRRFEVATVSDDGRSVIFQRSNAND